MSRQPRVLFWGRHGNYGPDYPRNRTMARWFEQLGWRVDSFQPRLSAVADWQWRLVGYRDVDLVWVPCFRQRDIAAAARWTRAAGVPLVVDPLISSYDKQVNEKNKFVATSRAARRLLRWESALFGRADAVVADTAAHADYFASQLGVASERLAVLPVSAEEALFYPGERTEPSKVPLEALFYGTFIGLQGSAVIAEAACLYRGPKLRLTLLGDGPERAECESIVAGGVTEQSDISVVFEPWLPFTELPARIRRADIALGIFGGGDKTQRVIPNKVYQSLACGVPTLTAASPAYPPLDTAERSGLSFVPAADPQALADALAGLASELCNPERKGAARGAAAGVYQRYFSAAVGAAELRRLLDSLQRNDREGTQ